MFKKKICKFFLWNFELFLFFFPKKIEINKKTKFFFAIKLYLLFKNFDFTLKIKFIILLIFLNILSLILNFNSFKKINIERKKKFINNLINLKINILSRGILALKSQSIIIFCSILKDKLYDN